MLRLVLVTSIALTSMSSFGGENLPNARRSRCRPTGGEKEKHSTNEKKRQRKSILHNEAPGLSCLLQVCRESERNSSALHKQGAKVQRALARDLSAYIHTFEIPPHTFLVQESQILSPIPTCCVPILLPRSVRALNIPGSLPTKPMSGGLFR